MCLHQSSITFKAHIVTVQGTTAECRKHMQGKLMITQIKGDFFSKVCQIDCENKVKSFNDKQNGNTFL